MSWRDRLVQASYKNVSFKVLSSEYEGGRRTSIHNFANREKPYLQDLGKAEDTFTIEAYIVQNIENEFDYFSERDNLRRALNSVGSGILIHPFLGIQKVGLANPYKMSETFEEGGIAKFSITFKEAGERALPESLTDFFSAIDNAVNQAMDMIGDAFYTAYSTVALFQDFTTNIINRSIGTIQSAISATAGIATKIISESVSNISLIRNSTNNIINSPNDIFNSLKNCCYSMASVCGMSPILLSEQSTKGNATSNGLALNDKPADIFAKRIILDTTVTGGESGNYSGVVRGDIIELQPNNIDETLGKSVITNMINLINNYDMSGLGNTPSNQENNLVLILDTFKFQIIATICRIAIRINFFSQDEAISYMENINKMIDNILIDLGNEAAKGSSAIGIGTGTTQINNKDIFLAIQDVRKVFVDNMTLKISSIVKAIDYRIPVDIETTLELAYNKYNDLNRAEEIYKRNKNIIKHPGFMPNSDVIRILDA